MEKVIPLLHLLVTRMKIWFCVLPLEWIYSCMLTACCYLCQEGCVIGVCLFVCLLATLCKNFRMDLHEIFREGWQWASEEMIKFWWRSGWQIWIRIATLVRCALVQVCTLPVLLVYYFVWCYLSFELNLKIMEGSLENYVMAIFCVPYLLICLICYLAVITHDTYLFLHCIWTEWMLVTMAE